MDSCGTLSPKNPTLSAVPGCASPVDCGLRTIRCAILQEEEKEKKMTGKKKKRCQKGLDAYGTDVPHNLHRAPEELAGLLD